MARFDTFERGRHGAERRQGAAHRQVDDQRGRDDEDAANQKGVHQAAPVLADLVGRIGREHDLAAVRQGQGLTRHMGIE